MNLETFSVANFRSIATTQKLRTGSRITTLIGPNNEGKSNILRALASALKAIPRYSRRGRVSLRIERNEDGIKLPTYAAFRDDYDWERDFPVSLQDDQENGTSIFDLEFSITDKERSSLSKNVSVSFTGNLAVRLVVGRANSVYTAIDTYNNNYFSQKDAFVISMFIGSGFNCQYIPAIRTAESAQGIVNDIVDQEFSVIEYSAPYRNALAQIANIQRPVLREISRSITNTLREFLPGVKKVTLKLSEEDRHKAIRRACRIIVDDGAKTHLRDKGDGVQSLAALSLMRHAALLASRGSNFLLAVEEPETHLHSKALHQLRTVIEEIADKHQVVMTTHNPVFVSRGKIDSNIIVTSNKAAPANSLEEIRTVLGVRPADNLQHAEIVLIVEGEDDSRVLAALFSVTSKTISDAMKNGVLAIDPLHGSSNLSFRIQTLRNTLCSVYVFVDHDDAGKESVHKAIQDNVITMADVKFATYRGKNESELEDFFDLSAYKDAIKQYFGVELTTSLMRGKNKWSKRIADCFTRLGQTWDDRIKKLAKGRVADAAIENAKIAINPSAKQTFSALVIALEERIERLGTKRDASFKTRRAVKPKTSKR